MTERAKILIVDDRDENLFTLRTVLQETGAEVVQANNGRDALKAVSQHDFALLVLDVKMPEMDGYELAELIRGRKKTSHVPIIFLSAVYSDDFHVFKGYESGAVDFITKPFNHDILLDKVRVFLELHDRKIQLEALVAKLQQSNAQLTDLNQRLQHEVTERQQAETRLQQYAEDLQEANEQLSQYAYVVSHDLKAPLRAIRNYAGFLREDLEDRLNEEERGYLTNMQLAVQEAAGLIDDILALSRVGQQTESTQPVALKDFLHALLTSLQLTGDDVRIVLADSWPTVVSEPVLLRQIFQNLISNAVKFSTGAPKRVELGWQTENDGFYDIYVRDNGLGIAPQYHEKIFRIFDRLHTKAEFEGSGIGLAIVKKAASKIGGSVRVESEPGTGSTFWVRIPRAVELTLDERAVGQT